MSEVSMPKQSQVPLALPSPVHSTEELQFHKEQPQITISLPSLSETIGDNSKQPEVVFPSEALFYELKPTFPPGVFGLSSAPLPLPEFAIPVSFFTESLLPTIKYFPKEEIDQKSFASLQYNINNNGNNSIIVNSKNGIGQKGIRKIMKRERLPSHPVTEAEKAQRRREINRNSQRRIRERRIRERNELKTEVQRLTEENAQYVRQMDVLNMEKAELLLQIREITEKWQRAVSENALLNRENIRISNKIDMILRDSSSTKEK